jgi:hypothetical protein
VEGVVFRQASEMSDKQWASFTPTWQHSPVHFTAACALAYEDQVGCRAFSFSDVNKTCMMTSFLLQLQGDEVAAPGVRHYYHPDRTLSQYDL